MSTESTWEFLDNVEVNKVAEELNSRQPRMDGIRVYGPKEDDASKVGLYVRTGDDSGNQYELVPTDNLSAAEIDQMLRERKGIPVGYLNKSNRPAFIKLAPANRSYFTGTDDDKGRRWRVRWVDKNSMGMNANVGDCFLMRPAGEAAVLLDFSRNFGDGNWTEVNTGTYKQDAPGPRVEAQVKPGHILQIFADTPHINSNRNWVRAKILRPDPRNPSVLQVAGEYGAEGEG